MNSTQPVGWIGLDGDNRVVVVNDERVQATGPTLAQLIQEGFDRR
jgi:hypothetical protein